MVHRQAMEMVNCGRIGRLWRWLIMVGWQAMEMVNYGRMAGYGDG